MKTITVSNWAELLEEVYRDTWNPSIERFRSNCVFRGAGLCDRGALLSGLARMANGRGDIRALERHLIRNFRKYAQAEYSGESSDWAWLPYAQHHGLPTRVLDWTFSPLIACHFATVNFEWQDRDGVVWCVDQHRSNCFLPQVLQESMQVEGADFFTTNMLASVAPSLDKFDGLSPEPFVVFFEPPTVDLRIANQFALCSVMSNPEHNLHEWLDAHEGVCKEIVIPAAAKREIRDKLDQSGVTERLIYPGPDGLARWLARYYRPV